MSTLTEEDLVAVVAFTRARLDEAEESPRRLLTQTDMPTPVAVNVGFLSDAHLRGERSPGLVVMQNPERELRDIKAKRTLLRRYEAAVTSHRNSRRSEVETARMQGRVQGLRTAVLLTAETYADHADYQQRWKP